MTSLEDPKPIPTLVSVPISTLVSAPMTTLVNVPNMVLKPHTFEYHQLGAKLNSKNNESDSDSLISPELKRKRKSLNTPASNYTYRSPATTPSGRDSKIGWYEMHEKHVLLAKNSNSQVILFGDSIIAGLSRYHNVWRKYFNHIRALNFGIGGDRTQHVLWRAENLSLNQNIKFIIIHCGTNNIDRDCPQDIADGIISIGLTFHDMNPDIKVIITGLLPRDPDCLSLRRKKINQVNHLLKKKCKAEFKNFYFMKHDTDWVLDNGNLDKTLFFSDYLHLVEAGNLKFAESIVSMLDKIKLDNEIEYSDDEESDRETTHRVNRRKGKRKHSRSPHFADYNRKKRRSYSPKSTPRRHRSRTRSRSDERRHKRFTAGNEVGISEFTPNKWSSARKLGKIINEEHQNKYIELDNDYEEKKLETVAKSIDISTLDDCKRKEARLAKFAVVGKSIKFEEDIIGDSKKKLEEISNLSKSQVNSSSNPSALVSRIKTNIQLARNSLSLQKRRKSLVEYTNDTNNEDSLDQNKLRVKKFFSDYGSGSESE